VEVNALLDATGMTPEAAAAEAEALVAAGHRCIKVKVARGVGSPGAAEDAARLIAIRDAVGPGIELRADANRRWNLNEALTFGGSSVPVLATTFTTQYTGARHVIKHVCSGTRHTMSVPALASSSIT